MTNIIDLTKYITKSSEYTTDETYSLGTLALVCPLEAQFTMIHELAVRNFKHGELGAAKVMRLSTVLQELFRGVFISLYSGPMISVRSSNTSPDLDSIVLHLFDLDQFKDVSEDHLPRFSVCIEVSIIKMDPEYELEERMVADDRLQQCVPVMDKGRAVSQPQLSGLVENLYRILKTNNGFIRHGRCDNDEYALLLAVTPYSGSCAVQVTLLFDGEITHGR